MEEPPDPVYSATAWERLLLECDKQGRVLWMNERARARLGSVDSILAALPASDQVAASQLLSSEDSGRRDALESFLRSSDRTARVPVRLIRLLSLDGRVVLSVEVRARASDEHPPQHEALRVLLKLQSKATHNYFRLAEAEKLLARRQTKSTGAIVLHALEIERTRIARELHSGVGQNLAAIKLNVELMEKDMPDPPEPVRVPLGRIRTLAEQAADEIRAIAQWWHPPDWKRVDLPQAINSLVITSGARDRFRVTLDLQPVASDIPEAVRYALYRAAQEGLTNVLRHSEATEVRLELGQRDDEIYLRIADNGKGFDVHEVLDGRLTPGMRGIGLRAIRDEVHGLGGRFELESGPGGTKMKITIPLTENR